MKWILFLLILLTLPLVSADLNTTINIKSSDDINVWANPNTQGETTYYLDGTKWTGNDDDNNDDIKSINNAFFTFSTKIPNEVEFDKINNRYAKRFRWIMETVFVPRTELYEIINYQRQLIYELQIQSEVYSKLFTEEELCNARFSVALANDLKKVGCYGEVWTYDNWTKNWIKVK